MASRMVHEDFPACCGAEIITEFTRIRNYRDARQVLRGMNRYLVIGIATDDQLQRKIGKQTLKAVLRQAGFHISSTSVRNGPGGNRLFTVYGYHIQGS